MFHHGMLALLSLTLPSLVAPSPALVAQDKHIEPTFKGVALSRWLQLLDDGDSETRLGAVQAVEAMCGRFGSRATGAVPDLARALKDADVRVLARYYAQQKPSLQTESRPNTILSAGKGH